MFVCFSGIVSASVAVVSIWVAVSRSKGAVKLFMQATMKTSKQYCYSDSVFLLHAANSHVKMTSRNLHDTNFLDIRN